MQEKRSESLLKIIITLQIIAVFVFIIYHAPSTKNNLTKTNNTQNNTQSNALDYTRHNEPNYNDAYRQREDTDYMSQLTPESLAQHIRSLPSDERQRWYIALSIMIDGIDRSMPVRKTQNIVSAKTRWVAIASGKVYHDRPECPKLKNAVEVVRMDVDEARERGFKPCSECYGER